MFFASFLLGVVALVLVWTYLWKPTVLKLYVNILNMQMFSAYYYYEMDKSDLNKEKYNYLKNMYDLTARAPRDFSFNEFLIIINNLDIDKEYLEKKNEIDDYTKNAVKFFNNVMLVCFLVRTPMYMPVIMLRIIWCFIFEKGYSSCKINECYLQDHDGFLKGMEGVTRKSFINSEKFIFQHVG